MHWESDALELWSHRHPCGSIAQAWIVGKKHEQKWSISHLWEHFLVPEHRIPISCILKPIHAWTWNVSGLTILTFKRPRCVSHYCNSVWASEDRLALLWWRLSVRGAFGITIIALERPRIVWQYNNQRLSDRGAFGVNIIAFERPRCVWTYYSNVWASEIRFASELHLDLL